MTTTDAALVAQQRQQIEQLLSVGNPDCRLALAEAAGQELGTQTNDDAPAGYVGEYKETVVALASAAALTTATPLQIAALALTAGDWEVSGYVGFLPAATTNITMMQGGVSSTTAQIDSGHGFTSRGNATGIVLGANAVEAPLPPVRFKVAPGGQTVYLNANAAFSVDALSAYGTIRARRAR
jgi:hypothetical protein